MTNADKIRGKTTEEMYNALHKDLCPPMKAVCTNMKCRECWLEWLNDEAED